MRLGLLKLTSILKSICMAGLLSTSSIALVTLHIGAQELTIHPLGYTDVIKSADIVDRENHQFPLSDQNNKGNWTLNPQFTDEFETSSLNTKRWHPTNPFGKVARLRFSIPITPQ